MKSFSTWSVMIMMSLLFLVYSKVCSSPENNSAENDLSVRIANLHFTADKSTGNMGLVTAEFDLNSESESAGEIQIIVDGRKQVNNRLFIKKGGSHYSVDFLLNYPEITKDHHQHSATAKLIVNGVTEDVIHQDFRRGNQSLAGSLGF